MTFCFVVLLIASGTEHQYSFSFIDLSVLKDNATVHVDVITKMKRYVVKML